MRIIWEEILSVEKISDDIICRTPKTGDGKIFWEIARDSKTLDVNSTYHYLIMCRHFGKTCIAAEHQGRVVGFVTGYTPPDHPDTLFIWQVAVDDNQRGKGLGSRMLLSLYDKLKTDGVKNIDATITTSNDASIRLFTTVARKLGAPFAFEKDFFAASDFGQNAHAPERLFHIGPIEN